MPSESTGYVYFVLSPINQLVKIGYSTRHPDYRFSLFRVGCPVVLLRNGFIRADKNLEKELHRVFAHHRSHGEWFRYESDVRAYIRKYAEEWRVKRYSGDADRDARIDEKIREMKGITIIWRPAECRPCQPSEYIREARGIEMLY